VNRDRTTALYKTLTAKVAGEADLVDLFDYSKLAPNGAGGVGNLFGTYHAFTGRPNAVWPTDLIFVGGSLKGTKGAEILRDHDGALWPSDHFFVMGEVGSKD